MNTLLLFSLDHISITYINNGGHVGMLHGSAWEQVDPLGEPMMRSLIYVDRPSASPRVYDMRVMPVEGRDRALVGTTEQASKFGVALRVVDRFWVGPNRWECLWGHFFVQTSIRSLGCR